MNIVHYIRLKLLQEGEAIIPKLGTFSTAYQPATFDKKSKKLLPPVKSVSFEFSEDISDNSLAKYIARQEGAKTEKVNEEIESYVSKVWRALNRGQKVHLTHIGMLFDKNDRIVFEFDESQNLLPSASGLKAVDATPISKDRSELVKEPPGLNKSKTKSFKPFTPPPQKREARPDPVDGKKKETVPPPVSERKNRPYPTVEEREHYFKHRQSPAFTLFLLLVVIALILVLLDPFYIGWLERKKPGLSPLIEHEVDKSEKIRRLLKNTKVYKPAVIQDKDIAKEDKPQNTVVQKDTEEPEVRKDPVVRKEEPEPQEVTASTNPVAPTQQYHIVIGSYPRLSLAREAVLDWNNKGYTVVIIGPARNGYYRLSLGQYNSKSAAERDLGPVKRDIVSDAWILKY